MVSQPMKLLSWLSIDDHELSWVKAPATLSIQIDLMIWEHQMKYIVPGKLFLSNQNWIYCLWVGNYKFDTCLLFCMIGCGLAMEVGLFSLFAIIVVNNCSKWFESASSTNYDISLFCIWSFSWFLFSPRKLKFRSGQ